MKSAIFYRGSGSRNFGGIEKKMTPVRASSRGELQFEVTRLPSGRCSQVFESLLEDFDDAASAVGSVVDIDVVWFDVFHDADCA